MSDVRQFETGATRDTEDGKVDYEGHLSPLAVEAFARYMHNCRTMPDGSFRASDNWQLGMPKSVYLKSAWRHFMSIWKAHRGWIDSNNLEKDLCALWFNVQGYLHELMRARIEKDERNAQEAHDIEAHDIGG